MSRDKIDDGKKSIKARAVFEKIYKIDNLLVD